MIVWRIAIHSTYYEVDDLSGIGSAHTGGRWNSKDVPVVYSSTSIALAALETLVHLNQRLFPMPRFLVEITIPDAAWAKREGLALADAPEGWNDPEPDSSKDYGTGWLISGRSEILLVPSVIVPEEQNVLINPAHPQASKIKAKAIRPWTYDSRLL
ncbi:hypothetical protein BI364_07490 [Acidihalobacter yilgarnensis]|uniref:RES domain-containing protein n=1 Tax=Acidihalobacter yilgarnensis TaxID=2819280 RepID=A0A1D8IMX3_9GAMM|nr:RES family NAD+ phosphorylase [Acidihalobacter yilgarnensis]AOU97828.1 hypothetical protein BI364_07490 [Acidihalobacter yilgarnensis]